MTVYAFGLEEHRYSGSGVHQSDNYYYSLGGVLVGESTGSGTNMFLTDALGSVIETISATANSATVQGNQVYSPYGSSRYQQGSMGTAKGFTGQYNDSVSGLDYYNARYYDPVVGRFLSVDIVQGNMQGLDPYAYVGGNPETKNDPTGHMPCAGAGNCSWSPPPPSNTSSGSTSTNGSGFNLSDADKAKLVALVARGTLNLAKSQVDGYLLKNSFACFVDFVACVSSAIPLPDEENFIGYFIHLENDFGRVNVNSGLARLGEWGKTVEGLSEWLGRFANGAAVVYAGVDLYQQLQMPSDKRNDIEIVADSAVIAGAVVSFFLRLLNKKELASRVSFAAGLVAFAGYMTVALENWADASLPPSDQSGDNQRRDDRRGGGGPPSLPPLLPAGAFLPLLLNPDVSEQPGPQNPGAPAPFWMFT